MKNIKIVIICKPEGSSSYEVGQKIFRGGKETDVIVAKIKIGLFKKVTITLSDGTLIISNGCSFIIEK